MSTWFFLGFSRFCWVIKKVVLHFSPYVPTILTSKFPPRRGPDDGILKPTDHVHLRADLGICGIELRLSILLIGAVLNYSPLHFDIYFSAL
jgi:hypothetical protein